MGANIQSPDRGGCVRGLWILSLISLTACAAFLRGRRDDEPTLEVQNNGMASVRVTAIYGIGAAGDTIGLPLGTVFSAHSECFRLEARSTPQFLRFQTAEGNFITPTFITIDRVGFQITLTGHPSTDRLSLMPSDHRCS